MVDAVQTRDAVTLRCVVVVVDVEGKKWLRGSDDW